MRLEYAAALISPVLPLHRAADTAEADWMRAFAVSRIALLGLVFAILPITLAVGPSMIGETFGVFVAGVAASTAGIVALRLGRPAVALAAVAVGSAILAAGPWIAGVTPAAAAIAVAALICDFIALPGKVEGRRWLALFSLGISGAIIATATLIENESAMPALAALVLFAAAPIATLALGLMSARYRLSQTLQRHTEEAARERRLAGAADAAVLVVDRGGFVLDAASAVEAILGCPAADLHRRGLIDRVLIADRPALLKAVAEAALDGRCVTLDIRLNVGDISPRTAPAFVPHTLTLRPVAGEPGHATIRIEPASASDVAEPLPPRGELLQIIAHEVRTPMNALLGFSDLLANRRAEPPTEADVADYARIIHRSARETFVVTQALVDLMRVEDSGLRLVPEPVDPADMLRSVAAGIASRAGAAAPVLTITGAQADHVVDPHLLRMLFSAVIEGMAAQHGPGARIACRIADYRVEMVGVPATASTVPDVAAGHSGIVETLCTRIAGRMGGAFTISSTPLKTIACLTLPDAAHAAASADIPVSFRKSA